MLERRREEPGEGPSVTEAYRGLRTQVLELEPVSVGLSPTDELPQVFGIVMDTTYPKGSASLVAIADDTTSLYTSTGGGLVGGGAHDSVMRASRELLRQAEAQLAAFDGDDDPSRLPDVGGVRMTALTYGGRRIVEAPEDDLRLERHPASSVFHAAHAVIATLRMVDEGGADAGQ